MPGQLPRVRSPRGGRVGRAAERAARRLWGDDADARTLVQEALGGDTEARSEVERIGHYLGLAIGSYANVFAPELVVVGGGFGVAAWAGAPARPRRRPPRVAAACRHDGRIVLAELGDDAGLVGAGLVGFEALDGER